VNCDDKFYTAHHYGPDPVPDDVSRPMAALI